MNRVYADRKAKGHFDYPSAGSVFKNDRSLGKPTGVLLDELGLKGSRIGNAQIAPYHANIIINLGGASAIDVYRLVQKAREEARRRLHVELEPEIQFIGEWGGVS
jgi:UDP-N-acetylmuramate dehydrogenase